MRPLPRAGLITAVVCASLTVLPSLVPRAALIQGLLAGTVGVLGYGLGCLIALKWPVRARLIDTLWLTLLVATLVAGWRWQAELAALMGVASPTPSWVPLALVSAVLVFSVWLLMARSVRWLTAAGIHGLAHILHPRVAQAGVVTVSAVVLVLAIDRLPQALVTTLHPLFVSMNSAQATQAPTSRFVSGGPASTVAWQALGAQGQQFVSAATDPAQLRQFSGRPARTPIRAFVGVDSASSAEDRAQLAVDELERLGGFQRAVIAIGTSAGSGTVDNGEVEPLEYVLNGDVATVSTQYSLLPSFLSFLVDRPTSVEAASTLLAAIRERAASMPSPPRLVVFGESLGAYGSSSVFDDLDEVLATTDGAMWQGPPNSSPLWRRYTTLRDSNSPQVQPVYDSGRHLRWANQPTALDLPTPWQRPRAVFLQNASDPVVWWSPTVLFSRPQWMTQPRGPGVLPWVPWLPVVTFAGLTGDMINSQGVPSGYGHVYGTDPVYAWAAILQLPGWTAQDSQALAAALG